MKRLSSLWVNKGITDADLLSDFPLKRAGLSRNCVPLYSPAQFSVCHLASFRSVGSKQAFSSVPSFKLQTGNVDMNDNQRQAVLIERENSMGMFLGFL